MYEYSTRLSMPVSFNSANQSQVNVYYGQNDVNIATEFRDRILEVVDKDRER